ADERERRLAGERVEECRLRDRLDEHVRLVDRLPAADTGSIEPQALFERALVEILGRDGEVLPLTGEVHEPEVNGLDFLFTNECQNFPWGHATSAGWCGGARAGDGICNCRATR